MSSKLILALLLSGASLVVQAAGVPAATPPATPAQASPQQPGGLNDTPILADPPAPQVSPQAVEGDCKLCLDSQSISSSKNLFSNFGRTDDAYSIVSVARGLSTHKPMFVLPFSYSPQYHGAMTEAIFAISAKERLFGSNFYFGYSQRSFWQVYDTDRSRPFRETDYNPEFFYRWKPKTELGDLKYWGGDVGIEHESNGLDVPQSRSWNRAYVAAFRARGTSLFYAKAWWRIPEDDKETPDDPKGDDNPDIYRYYGYGELHWLKQIGKGQAVHTMGRLSPETGKGAINIDYTIPSSNGYLFYQLYVWHGYGESLLDYNRSTTRVGIGIGLTR